MLDELLADSRMVELKLSERTIAFRRELKQARKVKRLEEQLAIARARASISPRPLGAN